jgi:ABC-type oligopeptide transport system substrate-binding subunit
VDLAPMAWEAFATAGASSTGLQGAFRFSWAPEYPSVDQYLAPLFSSSGVGEHNFSRWTNPAFDRVLQRAARTALEEVDRSLEYRRLERILCVESPLIPIAFDYDQYVVRPEAVGAAGRSTSSLGIGGLALRELYVRRP